jgi:hypothetical protein
MEIHHVPANPERAPARIPAVAAISPDIQRQERLRMPHMHKLRAMLVLGPGRSRRPLQLATTAAFVLGGVLLIWSAYVHFHLWGEADGYRTIPTIGPLFLLQSIAGLVIGIGIVAVRRLWAALIGIGFALSTIAGFLLSVAVGLFGFQDSWLAPFAKEAFIVELLAAVVLVAAAALCLVGSVPYRRAGSTPAGSAT